MANAAQKKLAAQNKRILTFMLAADLIVNVLFWILRFFVRSGLSKFSKFVYAFASISSGFLHYQLHRAAAPKYDARGSLLYVGQDLLQEGVTSYMVDYMYFSWILIFLAALTSVKVFAFYLLVRLRYIPFFFIDFTLTLHLGSHIRGLQGRSFIKNVIATIKEFQKSSTKSASSTATATTTTSTTCDSLRTSVIKAPTEVTQKSCKVQSPMNLKY